MPETVTVPGVGEGVLRDQPSQHHADPEKPGGSTAPESHSHSHNHGHGHGGGNDHHAHAHKEGEDQWDAEQYVAKPGAKRVAVMSSDSVLWALEQAGLTQEERKGSHLLEVGCGPGLVTSHLAPNFASLHAIDVSPSMLLYFSRTHSSSIITHSLHFLNPSSSTEFTQSLLSPLHNEPERRLTPPRNKFGVAVMNLVLHHVEDWSGLMQGIQGLLEDGGWFVGTEFGKTEDGRDVVKEAREQKGDAEMQARLKHSNIHHGALTPAEMISKLKSYGFSEAYAEIRGEMKMWDDAPAVPCLVFWAKK